MRGRDHFMPVSLLESQLQTLQVPDAAAPRVIIVDIRNSVERIVEIVCRWLSALFQKKDSNNSAGDYAVVMAAVLTGNPDALRNVSKDSVCLTDESGWSFLHAAADVGYANVARTLISLGAPLSAKATLLHSWTPLHVAAFKGNAEMVKVICEEAAKHSFSVDEKDDIGCTPLRLACHSGFLDCVALLISNGADVNSSANDGSTSLHVAASAGKLEVCRTLLDNGAAVEPVDNSGTYPLQLAKKAAHNYVCKLLIDRGARVGCC
jgi:26S proteasome non-ATPase regulatory subunit 10